MARVFTMIWANQVTLVTRIVLGCTSVLFMLMRSTRFSAQVHIGYFHIHMFICSSFNVAQAMASGHVYMDAQVARQLHRSVLPLDPLWFRREACRCITILRIDQGPLYL